MAPTQFFEHMPICQKLRRNTEPSALDPTILSLVVVEPPNDNRYQCHNTCCRILVNTGTVLVLKLFQASGMHWYQHICMYRYTSKLSKIINNIYICRITNNYICTLLYSNEIKFCFSFSFVRVQFLFKERCCKR